MRCGAAITKIAKGGTVGAGKQIKPKPKKKKSNELGGRPMLSGGSRRVSFMSDQKPLSVEISTKFGYNEDLNERDSSLKSDDRSMS